MYHIIQDKLVYWNREKKVEKKTSLVLLKSEYFIRENIAI
jgi:hypothetical protein